jgi:hypothetical protein
MDHTVLKYTERMITHLCVSGKDLAAAAAAMCCEHDNGALESGNFLIICGIVTFSGRVLIHTLLYMEVKPAL